MKMIGILGLALVVAATAQAETPEQRNARLAQNWETLQQYYPARARKAGEQGLVGFNIRIDKEGQPFWWPEADRALFQSIRNWIGPQVQLIELDRHINDPEFARSAAETLLRMFLGGPF